MRTLVLSTILFVSLILGVTSCTKEDPEEPVGTGATTKTFDARAYDKWVYFSFDKGEEVEITDFQNSTEWDIAFHRFDVRVNCGTSGPGQGGSISMGQVNFDAVTTAPTEGYSLNDSISIVNEEGNWTNPVTVPGDTIVGKWLYFTGPPPQYNITNEIYVVKTAQGKYSKIWLKDYYNDNSESGFVTMQYFYQKDGSTTLK